MCWKERRGMRWNLNWNHNCEFLIFHLILFKSSVFPSIHYSSGHVSAVWQVEDGTVCRTPEGERKLKKATFIAILLNLNMQKYNNTRNSKPQREYSGDTDHTRWEGTQHSKHDQEMTNISFWLGFHRIRCDLLVTKITPTVLVFVTQVRVCEV